MAKEGAKQSPQNPKHTTPKQQPHKGSMFSPRFRSVAALAGWDEESILIASLVVEDTPDRQFNHKKRSRFPSKTPPPVNSRTKRGAQRRSPFQIPVPVLNLEKEEEEGETAKKECERRKAEVQIDANEGEKMGNDLPVQGTGVSCSISVALPCMDRLREELSCAICLEICFEPSTTSCGHSFCKKCLRSAADKCGKRCPKCRQLISNGRSGTVNTVLWNTIQLLFPEEVETRTAAETLNEREAGCWSPVTVCSIGGGAARHNRNAWISAEISSRGNVDARRRSSRISSSDLSSGRDVGGGGRRRRGMGLPNQDEDAALAMRLQREEFMEAFRGTTINTADREQGSSRISSTSLARANLRAMASRAIRLRASRGRPH